MKYLSNYKLFENIELKKQVEEICYDLTDIGFNVNIRPATFSKKHFVLEIKKKQRN